MKNKNYYRNRANIAEALAHPSRLLLIDALSKKDMCVCELTRLIGADQTTVSKHLAVLKNAGLVEDRKSGLQVIYSIRVPCIMKFFDCAEGVIKSNLKKIYERIKEILIYGIGIGLPVSVFAVLCAFGIKSVGHLFNKVTRLEIYARKTTGIIFILAGLYYILAHIFYLL